MKKCCNTLKRARAFSLIDIHADDYMPIGLQCSKTSEGFYITNMEQPKISLHDKLQCSIPSLALLQLNKSDRAFVSTELLLKPSEGLLHNRLVDDNGNILFYVAML